ncbi:MOSC domain-containing protein [Adhaeribacter aquaticus]|uniref:MOSC domain-containing protein n=1 Tax=Adhaeribacter aquaticus TaxID=299567 RepID=UPI0004114BA8|nr:MOSC N-terminal beta barrel domain-containing protein [Adhaeribacter aquaticus]
MTATLNLSQINIYPIKSLGGISLTSSLVEPRGLQYDRRWLLVDATGEALTQRTLPEMALLQVQLLPNGLQVSHKTKSLEAIFIPFEPITSQPLWVRIWDDTCLAQEVAPTVSDWFSEVLQKSCKLVYMPEKSKRQVDLTYARAGEIVSFADSFPILLIGQESLVDLNNRLPEPVPMDRFRPNLVVTGSFPYAEDNWKDFTINSFPFKVVKPCARCSLTTIDQQTGQKSKEPLRTLATYRNSNNKILFGQNVLPLSPGATIQVGDQLEILSYHTTVSAVASIT